MTKEDILNYVMNSPENTNRMVLSDMLDSFSSNGGGGHQIPATWSNGSVMLGEISVDDFIEICSDVEQNATPCYLAIDYGGGHIYNIALSSALDYTLNFQDPIQYGSAADTAKIITYSVYEMDGSLNISRMIWEFSAASTS